MTLLEWLDILKERIEKHPDISDDEMNPNFWHSGERKTMLTNLWHIRNSVVHEPKIVHIENRIMLWRQFIDQCKNRNLFAEFEGKPEMNQVRQEIKEYLTPTPF